MQAIYSTNLSYEEILALDIDKLTFGEVRALVVRYGCTFKWVDDKIEMRIPFNELAKINRKEYEKLC